MSEEQRTADGMALAPAGGSGPSAAGEALLGLYHDLPGDVVAIVEYERQAIIRDTLDHLRHIRDALAPYGKFREWCQAVGMNYGTVSNRLSRADKDNRAVNESLTDLLLLNAPAQPQSAAHALVKEMLGWGIALRPARDTLDPETYRALRHVLVWWSLRREYAPEEVPEEYRSEALEAQVVAVLGWSVLQAEALQIHDYSALDWALTDEMARGLLHRSTKVAAESED